MIYLSKMKLIRGLFKNHKTFVCLLVIATILISYNINNRYLWLDESYTAIFAKNILKSGVPTAYDGQSIHTRMNGNDFNEKLLNIIHPWLHYYIIAFSFKLFGVGTTAARIPSILFGLLSIIGVYKLSNQISNADKKLMLYSTLIYTFSMPFLVSVRFCKYQALVMCFGVFASYFYFKFIDKQKFKYLIFLIIHSVLLFYSNYIVFVTIVGSLGIYHLLVIRNFFQQLSIATFIVIFLTLPWIIYIQVHNQGFYRSFFLGFVEGGPFFLDHLIISIWQFNTLYFPFFSLLIIFFLIKIVRYFSAIKLDSSEKPNSKHSWFFLILIVFTILVYNIFIPLNLEWWYISAFPFCAIFLAIAIRKFFQLNTILSYILVFIVVVTNVLHVMPFRFIDWLHIDPVKYSSIIKSPRHNGYIWDSAYRYIQYESQFRILLYDFIDAINSDYDSAAEGLIKYFENDPNPGKIVNSSLLSPAVLFYTDLKVVNQLNPDMPPNGPISTLIFTSYPNAEKFQKLTQCDYDKIDYFIHTPFMDVPFPFLDYLDENSSKFKKTYINYPDVFDSPNFLKSPKNAAGFYVYKRISK